MRAAAALGGLDAGVQVEEAAAASVPVSATAALGGLGAQVSIVGEATTTRVAVSAEAALDGLDVQGVLTTRTPQYFTTDDTVNAPLTQVVESEQTFS